MTDKDKIKTFEECIKLLQSGEYTLDQLFDKDGQFANWVGCWQETFGFRESWHYTTRDARYWLHTSNMGTDWTLGGERDGEGKDFASRQRFQRSLGRRRSRDEEDVKATMGFVVMLLKTGKMEQYWEEGWK